MRAVAVTSILIILSAACGSSSNEITASTPAASPSNAVVTYHDASTTVAGTSVSSTTIEASEPATASCSPASLLAAVAGLFPENPEWNPTAVTVDACRAGYAQLVVLLDQSACPVEGVDCRDNQRAWLRDVDGVWTLLDLGTGIGCPPEEMSPNIEDACAALGVSAGALDIVNGTMFGFAPNATASPDDVSETLEASLGDATWDTEWQAMPPEFACTGHDSYRTIWWGDVRMTFETVSDDIALSAWSVGDAPLLAPLGPLPPAMGPATGVSTVGGIGIGSSTSEVLDVFPDLVYDSTSQSIQFVSSTGLATMLYFDDGQHIVGVGSSRNDCGDGS